MLVGFAVVLAGSGYLWFANEGSADVTR
jgi:hypothetical protein